MIQFLYRILINLSTTILVVYLCPLVLSVFTGLVNQIFEENPFLTNFEEIAFHRNTEREREGGGGGGERERDRQTERKRER